MLFGDVNPSGKLTETIPVRLSDTPAYLDFPGEFGHVRYAEGVFVGYRWYDSRGLDVAFPFGHGLSCTTFTYGDATASVGADGDLTVTVPVTNTGAAPGRKVVQVYTSLAGSVVARPQRELKAFASVELQPGETREVTLPVRREDLAYWDIRVDRWVVEGGDYTVAVGASSRDFRSEASVTVSGDEVALPLSRESSLGEVMAHPIAGPVIQAAIAQMMQGMEGVADILPEGVDPTAMMASFPFGRISMMAGDAATAEMIDGLIAMANAEEAGA